MKVIAIKQYMKQGKRYEFTNGAYESINTDNEKFINYNTHFKKRDWDVLPIEKMTSILLYEIVSKKFYKSSRILRINIVNNYNGTKTFIVYHNNMYKCEYLVKG